MLMEPVALESQSQAFGMGFQDLLRGFTCCELFKNKLNCDSRAGDNWFAHHDSWIRRY